MRNFDRENELRLTIDDEQMMPDCAFQLASDGGDAFNYLVEIDNSTEPVYSTRQRDSLGAQLPSVDASHESSRIHTEIRVSVSMKIRPIRGCSTTGSKR